ncbi:DUF3990 domain-containing protein [Butyrivibrio sp. NC3005]|uniref:DUF3990 domain-containing protein n=1 Tax=Butyrivibrio sp. NC3005 TaxID=1280685 RepID=UPI0003FDA49E|nr:DUF3990 domain-containing protein [Butyrivibrio sp. NC3005]
MININCEYKIKEDIDFIIETEKINKIELSKKTGISRVTLDGISKNKKTTDSVCEKFYSYVYESNYRINTVKEELIKEKYGEVLFHGSKNGLSQVSINGSRDNCDFGNGFYLGENYNQALSFVCENEKSSVYSFRYSLKDLNICRFDCSMEWMLAICYHRGTLGAYSDNEKVRKIVEKINKADVIIAPIADNKMFYVMAQFTDGEINADVALHSLSASRLGFQYIFKTEMALEKLIPIEKYYLCRPERVECKKLLIERGFEIDTKLRLAKREFKTGLYIEEIFDERI